MARSNVGCPQGVVRCRASRLRHPRLPCRSSFLCRAAAVTGGGVDGHRCAQQPRSEPAAVVPGSAGYRARARATPLSKWLRAAAARECAVTFTRRDTRALYSFSEGWHVEGMVGLGCAGDGMTPRRACSLARASRAPAPPDMLLNPFLSASRRWRGAALKNHSALLACCLGLPSLSRVESGGIATVVVMAIALARAV